MFFLLFSFAQIYKILNFENNGPFHRVICVNGEHPKAC